MSATTLRKPQQKNGSNGHKTEASRTVQMKQSDAPSISLEEALRVPRALADQYGGRPTSVLNVAAALSMQPSSGPFRTLTGAAVAYGLTSGTAFADEIALTALGKRIVKPTSEGDDGAARREALLKPRVVGEFLKRYDNATIPRDDIALNVLEEMGVPEPRTQAVLKLIIDGAQSVGLIRDIKGKRYITLEGVPQATASPAAALSDGGESEGTRESGEDELTFPLPGAVAPTPAAPVQQSVAADKAAKRVYITHGKNRSLIDTIKKLLTFGELEAVVSVERPTVSQPVPDKIMSEMRSCGAAIIHVDAEQKLMDAEANEHVALNPNVLMEVGAAMALFGRRFILLVKDGIKLPSNLQGLYEVRYADTLDSESTVKLLEAIRDIKNHAMPERYSS